jgi:small conductance mechanosensitive channel
MQAVLARWAAQIINALPNILVAVVIFGVSLLLARLLAHLLRGVLERKGTVNHVVELLARLVYWTIIVVGAITALERFFDVTAFLAGLGILGFTVGFALQDVMKNFAAGVILLVQQPFRVGEAISVAGFDGTILAVDLRATEMSTFDGRLVSIPNGTVLTNPIINFTRARRRRVDLPLQIPPTADLEATRKIMLHAMEQAPGVVGDPAPTVLVEEVGEKAVKLSGSFWVDVSKSNPDTARDVALTRIRAQLEPSRPGTTAATGSEMQAGGERKRSQ